MRILVTGGTDQVGMALAAHPWPDDVTIVMPTRAELDLADPAAVVASVMGGNRAAVVNPAAYTTLDRAENEMVAVFAVDAMTSAGLASATKALGIPLVHVSTDYVFDCSKPGSYLEIDPVGPVGVYGASKEADEQAVRIGNPRHVILCTVWVFSPHGANFVKTMLRLAADRPLLRVVDDQRGCPTAAADIASALATITLRMIADSYVPTGIYHFVGAGEVTWYELARAIFRLEGSVGRPAPEVERIAPGTIRRLRHVRQSPCCQ